MRSFASTYIANLSHGTLGRLRRGNWAALSWSRWLHWGDWAALSWGRWLHWGNWGGSSWRSRHAWSWLVWGWRWWSWLGIARRRDVWNRHRRGAWNWDGGAHGDNGRWAWAVGSVLSRDLGRNHGLRLSNVLRGDSCSDRSWPDSEMSAC